MPRLPNGCEGLRVTTSPWRSWPRWTVPTGLSVCGAAPTAAVLVTARIAQGAAGGVLNPQTSATIQQLFQGAERGKAFGCFASVVSVASAIGPLAGGALIAGFGVHAG